MPQAIRHLDYRVTMRRLIPALTLITVSGQSIFNGFMLSMMFLKTSSNQGNELRNLS